MIRHVIVIAALSALLGACKGSNQVRRAPALDAPPTAAAQPAPKPGFFEQVGDATTRLVQEPAKIIAPKKPAEPEQPKVYDPPAAIIIRRPWTEPNDAPTTQPEQP